jgi:hypothetical protein
MLTKEVLDRAKEERDVKFLLGLIRKNPKMEQKVRDYLAQILEDLINRKIRRPAHRPAKNETVTRRYKIATRALVIEERADRKKMSQSVAEAAKEFGVSVSFVYGCLKKYRNEIEKAWRYQEEFAPWLEEREKKAMEGLPEDYEPDFDDWEETPELTDEEIEAEGEHYIEMLHEEFRGK